MNQTKFAEFVGVTPQRVSQWIQAGMAGVTWHGGRGKGTFIEPSKAIAWINERGYAMSHDDSRNGNGFPNLERLHADVSSIRSTAARQQGLEAIDAIWSAWEDAAQELVDMFDMSPEMSWDVAAVVLTCAHHGATSACGLPGGVPDDVAQAMEAGYPGPFR